MSFKSFCRTILFLSACIIAPAFAQEAAPGAVAEAEPGATAEQLAFKKKFDALGWTRSGKVKIGSNAEIEITEGLKLTGSKGAQSLLRMFENIPSGRELAILANEDLSWWALFTFLEDGYVKDDEKGEIKADEILSSMQENQEQGNKERKSRGLPGLMLLGWAVRPFFNEETKSMEFGLRLKNDSGPDASESVNYETNLLGRRGRMKVTLVCDPDILESSLAALRTTLKGFNYITGESYAEYRKGDKVANYGLTALVAGGGLALAAKSGLLGKLIKPIILGVVALGAGIKKFWGKITGRA
jgi:uncharacterized membrane-anchored protein